MKGAPHIDIVEDDEAVSESLVALLTAYGYVATVFPTAERFLENTSTEPVCILLDVRLPDMDGVEALQRYRALGGAAPVIVMTGHADVSLAVEVMRAGAQDFFEKPFDDRDLIARIDELKQDAVRNRGPFDALTPRETDVMREMVAGRANKVIAHRLGLSPKTVEVHRGRVMIKSGATSLADLVRMAIKAGVDPKPFD